VREALAKTPKMKGIVDHEMYRLNANGLGVFDGSSCAGVVESGYELIIRNQKITVCTNWGQGRKHRCGGALKSFVRGDA
jgi:hypothetical protein